MTFRHTFATDLLASGIPIEDVSVPLGHKSMRITEAYYSRWIRRGVSGWRSAYEMKARERVAEARTSADEKVARDSLNHPVNACRFTAAL